MGLKHSLMGNAMGTFSEYPVGFLVKDEGVTDTGEVESTFYIYWIFKLGI